MFKYFIYLFERQRERERGERERERDRERENEQDEGQREEQAPCREPDVGFDSGSPGSCPGLKAVLNH